MSFRKGQQVVMELHGAGVVTEEVEQIAYVRKGEVWVDQGPGNDPIGPFTQDGRWLGDAFAGFSRRLRAVHVTEETNE